MSRRSRVRAAEYRTRARAKKIASKKSPKKKAQDDSPEGASERLSPDAQALADALEAVDTEAALAVFGGQPPNGRLFRLVKKNLEAGETLLGAISNALNAVMATATKGDDALAKALVDRFPGAFEGFKTLNPFPSQES